MRLMTHSLLSSMCAGGQGLAALDLDVLQASCLGAMREYVVLCHKLRILPSLLEQIEVCVCVCVCV